MAKEPKRRKLEGEIVSAKMEKTAVVSVRRVKINHRYHKRIIASTRLKAENPGNRFKEGDFVILEETRPISKDKRWRILAKTRKLIQ